MLLQVSPQQPFKCESAPGAHTLRQGTVNQTPRRCYELAVRQHRTEYVPPVTGCSAVQRLQSATGGIIVDSVQSRSPEVMGLLMELVKMRRCNQSSPARCQEQFEIGKRCVPVGHMLHHLCTQ